MLVEYFVKRYAENAGKQISKIDKSTLKFCQPAIGQASPLAHRGSSDQQNREFAAVECLPAAPASVQAA
jgi:hypothetical protein